MFKLTLRNRLGNEICLTNTLNYSITGVEGLNPPSATINTSELALFDGATYNSSKVNMRSINISFSINVEAERNRIALYKVIKPKQQITLLYENGERNVFIDGYVESFEIDYFAMQQTATVSILCPEPFFKDAEEVINEISLIIANFHFPFSITAEDPIPFSYYEQILEINVTNDGDVASGMTIEIRFTGAVKNPTIYNRETREEFGLNYTFQSGDFLTIETSKGEKAVTLTRGTEDINLFNYLTKESTWLQLETGDNVFTYEADSGEDFMEVRFVYRPFYEGV